MVLSDVYVDVDFEAKSDEIKSDFQVICLLFDHCIKNSRNTPVTSEYKVLCNFVSDSCLKLES